MYAIIESGGHQYRVTQGDTIDVNLMDIGDADTVDLGNVLLIGGDGEPRVGAPFVDGAVVRDVVFWFGRAEEPHAGSWFHFVKEPKHTPLMA